MRLDPLTRSRVERITAELAEEFEGVYARGSVARLVEDTVTQLGTITVTRFVPVLVARFARDRLLASAQADGLISKYVPNVVFVCTENAGRSQMAAAITRHVSEHQVGVRSAGSDPAGHVDLAVIEVMAELGIDMAFEYPKPLTAEILRAADVVVTMAATTPAPSSPGRVIGIGTSMTPLAATLPRCGASGSTSQTTSSTSSRNCFREPSRRPRRRHHRHPRQPPRPPSGA